MAMTPQEQELLALVAEERRRNARAEQTVESTTLPELTPEMLLSAAAQKEVAAARSLGSGSYGWPTPGGWDPPKVPPAMRREQSRHFEAAEVEMTSSDFDTDLDVGAATHSQASRQVLADQALDSLFWNQEARQAQEVLGGEGPGSSGFDVSFDADGILEGSTSPNEAARWQVGRQDPPRRQFAYEAASPHSGPSEGVVVRRRENGAWQQQAASRMASVRSPETLVRALRTEEATSGAPRPALAPQPRPNVHRTTVYEKIARQSVFDDD